MYGIVGNHSLVSLHEGDSWNCVMSHGIEPREPQHGIFPWPWMRYTGSVWARVELKQATFKLCSFWLFPLRSQAAKLCTLPTNDSCWNLGGSGVTLAEHSVSPSSLFSWHRLTLLQRRDGTGLNCCVQGLHCSYCRHSGVWSALSLLWAVFVPLESWRHGLCISGN